MTGWQGVALVAISYVYFLIFAQFAFLRRLADLGIANAHLPAAMTLMAAGGIVFSLLTPAMGLWQSPPLRLRAGLGASATAALLTLLPMSLDTAIAVAFLVGAGLGVLTVTLATHLRQWTGSRNALFKVGVGTGIGYLICNIPSLFAAAPTSQAAFSAALCIAGICLPIRHLPEPKLDGIVAIPTPRSFGFPHALASFAALVWLDSAAFFIVQNTPALKAGTWQGSVHLWTIGLLHLSAALASAWLLSKRGLGFVLSFAFLALCCACLLLLDPHRIVPASILYPIGVSLYSVALVAYPSLLSPASSPAERGRQAGWIYAVAGWAGSAMGIGMGQNLGYVPVAFVVCAGTVVLFPGLLAAARRYRRELGLTASILVLAFCADRILGSGGEAPQPTAIERGRTVYISEGCIHCHSQYVRPNSPDVLLWGPVSTMQELRQQQPPLIGNRRQGPDLSQVGGRRSPLWLKAHFIDPPEVSGASIMPSYGFLFADGRGDDLVAYLASLQGAGTQRHIAAEQAWRPSNAAESEADAGEGKALFKRHCSTCHDAGGKTRWQGRFKRLPPDLSVGPNIHLLPTDSDERFRDRLAQIAKFGIPGTDMPGHEYLSDRQIASLSLWLSRTIARPRPNR